MMEMTNPKPRTSVPYGMTLAMIAAAAASLPPGAQLNLRSSEETIAAARRAEAPDATMHDAQASMAEAMGFPAATVNYHEKKRDKRRAQRTARRHRRGLKRQRGWA